MEYDEITGWNGVRRGETEEYGKRTEETGPGQERSRYCLLAFVTRFFTFCFSLFVLLFLSLNGFCQPGGEVGILGGGGYYQGEYNAGGHFKDMQRYVAGFYRYNFNDRFALRVNAGFSEIRVEHRALLPNGEETFPEGFGRQVKDFFGAVEFNFRSFVVEKIEKSSWWAPYIFTGAGYFSAGDVQSVSIPMGVGIKFNLYRQWSCGIEWTARKLFTDKVDGVYDPWGTGETNFIYNKDWFFVAGFTLSYRFPVRMECHF